MKPARFIFEKITIGYKITYKLKRTENVAKYDELPSEYFSEYPFFCYDEKEHSVVLCGKTTKVVLYKGMHISEREFCALGEIVKLCGEKLHNIIKNNNIPPIKREEVVIDV